MSKMILVWRFHDAPSELQALSSHGGDEDWLALVPKEMSSEWIPWLEHGSFGVCDISRHVIKETGDIVCIGAHS